MKKFQNCTWTRFKVREISMDRVKELDFSVFATLGLHLGFSAKLKIWQVPACKMEPRSGYIMQLGPTTHPPTASVGNPSWILSKVENLVLSMLCGVPTPLTKYVRCPHPNKVCAVSPPSKYMIFPEPNCYPLKKVCAVSPPPI